MLVGTAAVLGAAMVLAACSGSSGGGLDDVESAVAATTTATAPTSTSVDASAATPASPTTTTALVETEDEGGASTQPLPSVGVLRPSALTPGEYTTTIMTPGMAITVDDGWLHLGEFEPLLLMSRDVSGGRQQDFLNFVTFPASTVDEIIDVVQAGAGIELAVSEDQPAEVGGAQGRSFIVDVTVPGGGSAESFAFPSNRLYRQVPLDPPRFSDGDRARLTVVQVDGDVLTIIAGADAELDFDAFLDAADGVIATVRFNGSVSS